MLPASTLMDCLSGNLEDTRLPWAANSREGFPCPQKANWEEDCFSRNVGVIHIYASATYLKSLELKSCLPQPTFPSCSKYRAPTMCTGISIECDRTPEPWRLWACLAAYLWFHALWESTGPWICRRRPVDNFWSEYHHLPFSKPF